MDGLEGETFEEDQQEVSLDSDDEEEIDMDDVDYDDSSGPKDIYSEAVEED